MATIQKFDISDVREIHDYYHENGYVVINKAISEEKIDGFMQAYDAIRRNPFFVYYSQSTHVGTRPSLNAHGYIQESMQNASRLAFFGDFCKKFQQCIYDAHVADALSAITGEKEHVSWQNMFFDQSTGTIEHQDSWYLDTEPAGDLMGVWYALEDIQEDSGPFFLIPGSHKMGLIDRKDFPNHDDFVAEVQKKMAESSHAKIAMTLDKGDILLWHSFLIHGAYSCSNPAHSRKSFTSHYYPKSRPVKDTESGKLLSIYNHNKPRRTGTPGLYSAYRFNDYLYNMMVYALFAKHRMTSVKKIMSMRRDDYAA